MPANMEQEFGGATSHSETFHPDGLRGVTSQHPSSASTSQQPLRSEEKKGGMTSGHATGTSTIQRHPEYFFADGSVVFQVCIDTSEVLLEHDEFIKLLIFQ